MPWVRSVRLSEGGGLASCLGKEGDLAQAPKKFVEERSPLTYSNNQPESREGWDGETISDFKRIHGGLRHFLF